MPLIAVAKRYGLVACVSGRRATTARRIVSLGSITYVGNHGAEVLRGGATEVELDPEVAAWSPRMDAWAREAWNDELRRLRVRAEDKDVIRAFHWRGAPDEDAAEAAVRELAERAEEDGLVVHWGRKVLEVRPPVELNKGRGVEHLLEGADIAAAALRRRRHHRPRRLRGAAPRWRPTGACRPRSASACAPTRRPPSSRPRPTCSSTARSACARCCPRWPPSRRCASSTCSRRRSCSARRGDAARRSSPSSAPRTTRRHARPHRDRLVDRRGDHRRRARAAAPQVTAPIGRLLADAQAGHDAARAPARRGHPQPPVAAAALDRGGRRDRLHLPADPAVASGFAIIWSLAWRRQDSAVLAIEERDGVTFYVERTSPIRPMQLVRTPGLRREVPTLTSVNGTR